MDTSFDQSIFDFQKNEVFQQEEPFLDFSEFAPEELQTNFILPNQLTVQLILEDNMTQEKICLNNLSLNLEQNQTLALKEVLLRVRENFPSLPQRSSYFLWDYTKKSFIYLQAGDFEEDTKVPLACYENNNMFLKFCTGCPEKKKKKDGSPKATQRKQSTYKRVKERVIEEAVELVSDWRDLYHNGYVDSNNVLQKAKNFEHAARMLQISRKTLDDYYKVLRKATQYGFDFQENKHKKMRVLRDFVKAFEKNLDFLNPMERTESSSDSHAESKSTNEDSNSDLPFEEFNLE